MQTDWPARHPSPKKSPGPRIATTAGLIHHSKLHAAVLNVHDGFGGITLREDRFSSSKCVYFSAQTGRVEEQFHIENRDF
jgi:hypothetical protein